MRTTLNNSQVISWLIGFLAGLFSQLLHNSFFNTGCILIVSSSSPLRARRREDFFFAAHIYAIILFTPCHYLFHMSGLFNILLFLLIIFAAYAIS